MNIVKLFIPITLLNEVWYHYSNESQQ